MTTPTSIADVLDGAWTVDSAGDVCTDTACVAIIDPAQQFDDRLTVARLIAAAPELLEVIARLDAMWLRDWEPPHVDKAQQEARIITEECLDIWRDARAAIAKARGVSASLAREEGVCL